MSAALKNLNNDYRRMSMDFLSKLSYTNSVIRETLRLYPIASELPVQTKRDVVLSGYRLPALTNVMINIVGINNDPERYSEPQRFFPERWMNSDKDLFEDLTNVGAKRESTPSELNFSWGAHAW